MRPASIVVATGRASPKQRRKTGRHGSKSRRSGSMRCTRTTSLAATRRVEQLKKAGAQLATLNNDLIR
jgi:hypothetical protein